MSKNAIDNIDAVLGIDIGSTTISCAVVDITNGNVAEAMCVPNNSKLESEEDLCEFDASVIVKIVKELADKMISKYKNIKCIGFTGQMHGILYVAQNGKAVSPLYNWQDGRGNRFVRENVSYCDEIYNLTGYACGTGFGFVTMFYNKALGLEPKQAHSFCSIMDYAAMLLTDNKTPLVHSSNAASFGLFDVEKNEFDIKAVEKLGITESFLPKIAKDNEIVGFYKGIPVCHAIGDNQASFFGSVGDESTSALCNYGTGSQISIVCDRVEKTQDNLEIRPYLFGKYLLCGCALCGGKAYAAVQEFFSGFVKEVTGEKISCYEAMNCLAQKAYDNKKEPLNVSTLFSGTRKNPLLCGSITGITLDNFSPDSFVLGVLCGMANELYGYFKLMKRDNITQLVASGNAVKKNKVLELVLKDIFGKPLSLTNGNEEAATGCALYAAVVTGNATYEFVKNIVLNNLKTGE